MPPRIDRSRQRQIDRVTGVTRNRQTRRVRNQRLRDARNFFRRRSQGGNGG